MKKEHLIAVIAICVAVMAGIMLVDSYEKRQIAEKERKAAEAYDRMMEEAYKRSVERIRRMKEANP